jgi:glycosyltransferase involved in cell wall biosynthesis
MESRIQAKQLQEMGLSNAIYVPNYKKLDILDPRMIRNDFSEPYPYCTFSRVVKEKGISDAISAVTSINHKMGRIVATVDVYGPVDPGYKTEFEKLLAQSDGACKYVGVASAEESVSILKNYYSLLFPTYWLSEGMPGTIIDAMSAGLPVIARRWLFCDELITNRQNGLVYDFDKPEELENCIAWSMSHKNKMIAMRKNCLEAARQYSEDIVIPQILTLMGIN